MIIVKLVKQVTSQEYKNQTYFYRVTALFTWCRRHQILIAPGDNPGLWRDSAIRRYNNVDQRPGDLFRREAGSEISAVILNRIHPRLSHFGTQRTIFGTIRTLRYLRMVELCININY